MLAAAAVAAAAVAAGPEAAAAAGAEEETDAAAAAAAGPWLDGLVARLSAPVSVERSGDESVDDSEHFPSLWAGVILPPHHGPLHTHDAC